MVLNAPETRYEPHPGPQPMDGDRQKWTQWRKTYTKTREWERIAHKAAERDEYCCVACGDEMQCVHHKHYRNAGHEGLEDLVSLCNSCHYHIHERARKLNLSIEQATDEALQRHRVGAP